MRNMIVASIAFVGAAHFASNPALAAGTRFVMQLSLDGGTSWQEGAVPATPGTQVRARLVAQFVGPESVTGLAGFNTQLTVSDWQLNDTLASWGTPTTNVAGSAGGVNPGENGRARPFAAASTATLPTTSFSSGTLTIEGSTAGRLAIGQGPSSLSGAFFSTSLAPVVFQFGFTLGPNFVASRTISASNIFIGTANNARWYTGSGSTTINAPATEIVPAQIVVPTPGVVALMGMASLMVSRRRR